MVEPLRHRQTKEAETDMSDLQPPRHISTLPLATDITVKENIGISICCRQSEEAMPSIEIWIAMDENGGYEVATDEDVAIENLINGSSNDLEGTTCRVVKLNVTMSLPHERDDDNSDGPAVDVAVSDEAGRNVVIEMD